MNPDEEARRSPPRWWLRLVASAAIAGLALFVASRRVGTIPDDFTIEAGSLPAYAAALLAYFFLRALRWWFLVRAIAEVPLAVALKVALAGFLWIIALPWRLGELARPILLAESAPIGVGEVLGTVALERIADGLVICGVFFAAVAARAHEPAVAELFAVATTVSVLFVGALAVVIAMAIWPRFVGAIVRGTVGRLHRGLADRLAGVADGVGRGLRALPSPWPLLAFVLTTAIYWAVNALGMWILAGACGLPLGLVDAAAVMTIVNLALLVPGPPAHLGTFQLGLLGGLALSLPADVLASGGVRYAFYLYTTQVGACVLLGVWAQARLGIPWRSVFGRLTGGGPDPGGATTLS
ncbi:MAG: lysylphosphatidylglycerol synthase transmembrane domain-containing protein [Nannocystaceae bacterium]